MIGAARCSRSAERSAAAIMSGRASTTTYVSAAANATATDATASSARPPGARGSVSSAIR